MYKLIVTVFTGLLLIPNLWAIISGSENWPYTPAPMFADYIGEDTPRYSFAFQAEFEDGSRKKVGYYSVGANWSLMRLFFKYVYGSVAQRSVFTVYRADSKIQFEARLSRFFKAFVKEHLLRNPAKLQVIKLFVVKLLPHGKNEEERHLVGEYHLSDERFHHTWVNS